MTSKNDDRTQLPPNTPTDGRALQQSGPQGGRGNSIQGEHQDAKGGPAGANQGGASRGTSRLEPSHTQRNDHHTSKHATNRQRNEKK